MHKSKSFFLFGSVSLLCLCFYVAMPACADSSDNPSFDTWLMEFQVQARAHGISGETLTRAFENVSFLPRVIELDRRQPEFTQTLDVYLANAVSAARVRAGNRRLKEHADLLVQISRQYKVPPRLIVALWGIETNYGSNQGSFPVVDSLATLAYEGRRAAFFRKELLSALEILEQGHIDVDQFKGSWAGAMGQSQFMPSSFLAYARDFDGDQRIDIWNSMPDVFASIANYLARTGWKEGQSWGFEVRRPPDLDDSLIQQKKKLTLSRWQSLNVTPVDGRTMSSEKLMAYLVVPDSQSGRSFLAKHNYEVLLRWNRSNYFAVATGKLSDALADTESRILETAN